MNPASLTTEYPEQARCPYLVLRDPDVVREVLHRPADFSPANALLAVTPLTGPALRVLQRVRFALPPVLASNDTDTHAGIRKVVAGFFSPAKVSAMEPRIRELAQEGATKAREELDRSGQTDLVQTVAAFPPAVVMLELLGLPVSDLGDIKRWGVDSMELFWGWPSAERQLELANSAAEFYVWLRQLVMNSANAPGRNLFKSLAAHGLSMPEICSLGYFLLIAGQETTTQLISTALFRLLEGSVVLDESVILEGSGREGTRTWEDAASPEGSRSIISHVLATESSVPTWRRVAAHDTQLGDDLVPAGAEILLELSGNLITADAESPFLPPRETAGKSAGASGLVFGSGIHRCLGAKLAELEAAIIVQEAAAALPGVTLRDTDPDWIRFLSFQAPRTVFVS